MTYDFEKSRYILTAVFLVLVSMPIFSAAVVRRNDMYRIISVSLVPYLLSFSPVALLVYLLYVVSFGF